MSIDGEWVKNTAHIYTHTHTYTMKYYSTFTKKEIVPFMKNDGILATIFKEYDSVSLSKVHFNKYLKPFTSSIPGTTSMKY